MADAEQRLEQLRLEYQRAAQIMDQRRSAPSATYVCWTQAHLDSRYPDGTPDGAPVISDATRRACKREGVSGREAFRDDGAKDAHGNRVTIRVCSYQCFQDYQRWKGMQRVTGATGAARG